MSKVIVAIIAVLALVLGGSAAASADPGIVVTRSVSCAAVNIAATGYGLSTDSAFQVVASYRAVKLAPVQRTASGVPFVTATFTGAEVGENGTSTVRTRYGGYLIAWAQVSAGAPYTPAELIAYRVCP